MLLDLLYAELAQYRVAVSSLCVAAAVPPTTALRWLTNLVKLLSSGETIRAMLAGSLPNLHQTPAPRSTAILAEVDGPDR